VAHKIATTVLDIVHESSQLGTVRSLVTWAGQTAGWLNSLAFTGASVLGPEQVA
jgi:hypothetical protein